MASEASHGFKRSTSSRAVKKLNRYSIEIASSRGSTGSSVSSRSSSTEFESRPIRKRNDSSRKSITLVIDIDSIKDEPRRSASDVTMAESPLILSPHVQEPNRDLLSVPNQGEGRRRSLSFGGSSDAPDLPIKEPQIDFRKLWQLVSSAKEPSAPKKAILKLAVHFYGMLVAKEDLMRRISDAVLESSKRESSSQRRILQFLSDWIEAEAGCLSEDVMWNAEFRRLTASQDGDEVLMRLVKSIVAQLKEKSTTQQRRTMAATAAYPPTAELHPAVDFRGANARALAQQYSMYLMRLFLAIPTSVLSSTERIKTDPSLKAFLDCGSMMTQWCNSHLERFDGIEKIRAITKLIEVGKHLSEFQNYCGLMSVIVSVKKVVDCAEFQSVSPHHKDIWYDLMTQVDDSNNYNRLRRAMCDAAPPCVPHLKLFIDDIASIESSIDSKVGKPKKIPLRKALAMGRVVSILHTMKELDAEANFDWEWNDSVAGCFLNHFVKYHESHKLSRRQSTAALMVDARTGASTRRPSRSGSDMSKRHSVAYLSFNCASDADPHVRPEMGTRDEDKPRRAPSNKSIPTASTPPPAATGSVASQDAEVADSIKVVRVSKKKKLFKSMENVFSIFRRSPTNK